MEDVRIPAAADGRSGSRTTKNRKAGAHTGGQREVCCTLQEPAVLSQPGNETKKGAQSVRVRPRTMDGAVHQDEHGVPQAGQRRLRDELLQVDEQLGIWKDNGESAKPRRCEDSAGVGDKQDPQAGIGPVLRQIHTFQQRHGRHTHAQKAAGAEQAGVHRNDDIGKQQDTDVRLLLQPPESQIRAEVRVDLQTRTACCCTSRQKTCTKT